MTILPLLLLWLMQAQTEGAPLVTASDMTGLCGARWNGTLTYRDFSSGKGVTIRSGLRVEPLPPDSAAWLFRYSYPDEPHADGIDTVLVTMGGRVLDGAQVVERTNGADGSWTVVTERRGRDNNRPARLRHTYRFEAALFSVTKEVLPEDEDAWLERNRYEWQR
jgi:hypothetical protein